MSDRPLDGRIDALLSEEDDLTVVAPDQAVLQAVVDQLAKNSGLTTVRILAGSSTLRLLRDRFLHGLRAADLVSEGALAIRSAEDLPGTNLVLGQNTVSVLIPTEQQVGVATTTDTSFTDALSESLSQRWADASQYDVRHPPLSTTLQTVQEQLSEQMRADLDTALGCIDRSDIAVNKMELLVLLAAKNTHQQYRLSRWTEDIGIASIASMSRTKQSLEGRGILDTESDPVDIGRPRERLQLTSELKGADVDALVQAAAD